MPTPMRLTLRFRPRQRNSSCYQVAAVLEDLEALYFAVPKALSVEEPVQRHLLAEHGSRIQDALGLSGDAFSEIEYRVRAIKRLERIGADDKILQSLRAAVQLLADADAERICASQPLMVRESRTTRIPPLRVRRVSMASPLQLSVVIAPEYWMSASAFILFLGAIERRFNMIGRIRTEKVDLAARRRERRADEIEAQVREAAAQQTLVALRARERHEDWDQSPLLGGLEPAQQQFELKAGKLSLELNDEDDRAAGDGSA